MAATAKQQQEGPADEDPLAKLRARDPDAMRAFYEEHAAAVSSRLARLCGDADVARDLTQDVFVLALNRLDRFRGDSSLSTWLHGIAYNLLRDHRRAQRTRRSLWERLLRRAEPTTDGGPMVGEGPAPERALLERLSKALEPLAEAERDAFVLRVVEGLSLEETAAIVDASVKTVSYRAKQAEKKVRAHFEESKP